MGASIFFTAAMIRAFRSARSRGNSGTNLLGKKFLSCSFYLYRFRKYVSYGFLIINFCNPGVHYETPCITWRLKSKSERSQYRFFLPFIPDCFLLVFHFTLPVLSHALVKRYKRRGEPRYPPPLRFELVFELTECFEALSVRAICDGKLGGGGEGFCGNPASWVF